MKRTFLLLMAFVWLTVSAQTLVKTATFNFANPKSLSPSVTPSSSSGGLIALDNYVFTNEKIKISFGRLTSQSLPADLWTYVNTYSHVTSYYLAINPGSTVTISGKDVSITKIVFEDNGDQGTVSPLKLTTEQSGSISDGVWTPTIPTNSVTFTSNAKRTLSSKVIVTYDESSVILTPNSVTPANNTTVDFFSEMSLVFATPMNVKTVEGITLTGTCAIDNSSVKKENFEVSGAGTETLTLKLADGDKITKDGTYTITIPARCFYNGDGYENVALSYKFKVYEPRNTFIPIAKEPAEGDIYVLPQNIYMTFDNDIRLDDRKISSLTISKDGVAKYTATLKTVSGAQNKVLIESSHQGDVLNTEDNKGLWTVNIPEGAIHNPFKGNTYNDRWNPELTLTYNLTDTPDPLQAKKDSVVLLSQQAATLYALVGQVGYPKVDNAEHPLATLINMEVPQEEKALNDSIAKLLTAIAIFYNTTDVVLPQAGKWYKIYSVNNAYNQVGLYFDNGAVKLGSGATPFQVESIDAAGVAILKVKSGKDAEGNDTYMYLHVLLASDDYVVTSTANVTENKSFVNNLTLAKMLRSGTIDPSSLGGLFTIKGSVGTDKSTGMPAGDAYALVVHGTTPSIATSIAETALYFESDKTSAFRFEETTEPLSVSIKAKAVFEGSSLDSNTKQLTLTIQGKDNASDITKASLSETAAPYFTHDVDGKAVKAETTADPILVPIENTTNQFKVYVTGLADDTYNLVMPVGTFDFSQNANMVEDAELKAEFTIKAPVTPPDPSTQYKRLPSTWNTIPDLNQAYPVRDSVLLDIKIYMDMDIYPSNNTSDNVVALYNTWNLLIGHGHLEPYYDEAMDRHMVQVVFDRHPIQFPVLNGDYGMIISEAAFGDENFNKRQNGDTSIAISDCSVNNRFTHFLTIDNSVVPDDPLKDKKALLASLIQQADSLSNYIGLLCYPKSNETDYPLSTLKNMSIPNTEVALNDSISKITTALTAFYNTTDVVMPKKDRWYTIYSVNKERKQLALHFEDGSVKLGDEATPFQVESITDDGVAVLKVKSGKNDDGTDAYMYLHVLLDTDKYIGTSPANVTAEKTDVNDLTLSKMLLTGTTDQTSVLGLMTIRGYVGKDKVFVQPAGDANALVVHGTTPSIATSVDETAIYFGSEKTHAFRFVEASEPVITEVKAQAILEETQLDSNTKQLKLYVVGLYNEDDISIATLKADAAPYFTHVVDGQTVKAETTANPILVPVEGTDNQFLVYVTGLADDTYNLVLPVGTFDFTGNPGKVTEEELKAEFTIKTPVIPGPTEEYKKLSAQLCSTIPYISQAASVKGDVLSDVTIYMLNMNIYPSNKESDNIVALYDTKTNNPVALGHLESYLNQAMNLNMVRIVYDNQSLVSPLADGTYILYVPQAAFGDENFNKRQNGDTSIAISECSVNEALTYYVTVDNTTGINAITIDADKNLIYDLQGRRVTKPSKGLYIINGKRVVMK